MAKVTLYYTIDATNTGAPHDLILGCSLLGNTVIDLPWLVFYNVSTGGYVKGFTIQYTIDIPAGNYTAIAKAWENRSGGTKIKDITYDGQVIGAIIEGGTLTGELDRATQSITIAQEMVSATIDNFAITI